MAYAKSRYDQHHRSAAQSQDASQNASHRGHEFMAHGGGGNHLTNYPQDDGQHQSGSRHVGKLERSLKSSGRNRPSGEPGEPREHGEPRHQGYSGYVSGHRIDEEPGQPGQGHSRRGDPDYHQWRSEQIRNLDREYEEYRRERYRRFASDFETWRNNRRQEQGRDAKSGDSANEAEGKSEDSLAGTSTSGLK